MSVESRALSMRSDRVARRFVARYGAKVALDRAATLRGRLSRLALTLPDYMWLVNYSTDLQHQARNSILGGPP